MAPTVSRKDLLHSLLLCLLCVTAQPVQAELPFFPERAVRTPPPVLSAVLDGSDEAHLARHLQELASLHKHKGIRIGEVLILGQPRAERHRVSTPEPHDATAVGVAIFGRWFRWLAEVAVTEHELVPSSRVLNGLPVRYSPTWIVRHRGKDYIFDGLRSPARLFSRDGTFNEPEF